MSDQPGKYPASDGEPNPHLYDPMRTYDYARKELEKGNPAWRDAFAAVVRAVHAMPKEVRKGYDGVPAKNLREPRLGLWDYLIQEFESDPANECANIVSRAVDADPVLGSYVRDAELGAGEGIPPAWREANNARTIWSFRATYLLATGFLEKALPASLAGEG